MTHNEQEHEPLLSIPEGTAVALGAITVGGVVQEQSNNTLMSVMATTLTFIGGVALWLGAKNHLQGRHDQNSSRQQG